MGRRPNSRISREAGIAYAAMGRSAIPCLPPPNTFGRAVAYLPGFNVTYETHSRRHDRGRCQ